MYLLLHHLLNWTYLLLPPVTLVVAVVQARRRNRPDALALLVLTCGSAIFIGAGVTAASSSLLGGHLHPGQIASTWYFIVGVLCVMKTLRWGIGVIVFRLLFLKRSANGRPRPEGGFRKALANVISTALLISIGIPLVIGALVARRVRTSPAIDPQTTTDLNCTTVELAATDGNRVAGWWVPADAMPDEVTGGHAVWWGHRTVLICQGFGEDREREMALIWLFATDGYNVLAIDPRGQGDSGGAWGSFGDLERHDVLGAVRWIKANHTVEAQRVFGMGVGTGGAALIAAATDSTRDGQEFGRQIDALAVANTFADFAEFVSDSANARMPKAVAWVARKVILPFASAHAGSDLQHFAPAKLVDKLWPRPILVIHGRGDQAVPYSQGFDLFNAASQPKQYFWLNGDHNGVLRNPQTAARLREFFATARPRPVI